MDAQNRNRTLTESVTEGVTEGVAGGVTENVTGSVTRNVTESVAGNVTENVTGSVAKGVTENVTGGVTEGATPGSSPKMTKKEAQQKTDAELLQMIQQAQNHTGTDFGDHMNCDFSYSYLTNLIRDRGYEKGWHKTSEGSSPVTEPATIPMRKSKGGTVRKTFTINKDVADTWLSFNQNIQFPSVTIEYALRRFMEDYYFGRIKFEQEL